MMAALMTEEERERLAMYREYAKAALTGILANSISEYPKKQGEAAHVVSQATDIIAKAMLERERFWVEQEGKKDD